jgi:uncharacterized protein (DUF433 family)
MYPDTAWEYAMLADKSDLILQYIAPNPYRPGVDEAMLVESGIPVWALVGAITLAHSTPEEVAADYEISLTAVHAALAYYERHTAAIDARIAANHQLAS